MNDALEQARKKAILNRVIMYFVKFGIPLIFGIIFGISEGEFVSGLGCFVVLSFFSSGIWSICAKNKAYAEYIMVYKKEMIQRAMGAGQIYENMDFRYDVGVNPDIVRQTGFLSVNRFFSNCFISGTYDGISFFQGDIRNVRGQRGGYNLEYDGTLIAVPTSLPDTTQTVVYHKDIDCNIYLHGSQYKTGNAVFDKEFQIHTTAKEKAAALLTPDFMNKLTNIQNQIPRRCALTVKGGWMYILLPNKKSVLKPKLFGKYDESMKAGILKELSDAKLFMDAFSR